LDRKNLTTIIYGNISKITDKEIFVTEADLEMPHGQDYKIALTELSKIKDQNIDGKPFLEYFQNDDYSLWWFIFPNVIPVYKKFINFIISFQKLIDEVNPDVVYVEDDFEKLNLIKQLCEKNHIQLNFSKLSYSKYLMKQKLILKAQKSRYSKITKLKIKRRKNYFFNTNKTIPSFEDKVIFAIPNIYRRKFFDYKTEKSKDGEYIQDTLINLLKNESILGIDIDYTFKGNFEKSIQRFNDELLWIPIEYLVDETKHPSTNSFLKKYFEVIKKNDFQKLFIYKTIELWPNLKDVFEKMSYFPNLPFYIQLITSLKEIFQKNPPKAIFLPYETGPYALAIILACEMLKTKTIGISHGFIAENIPMYSHYCCKSKENMLGHPIPSTTLVFGEFAKNILVKAGYPSTTIIPFGNPAFFNFTNIENAISKIKPREKYEIKDDVTVILFTSGKLQPKYAAHGNYNYDVQIWEKLISTFSNNEKYFIILKPHPQEIDVSVYEEIIQKYNTKNSLILHGDLFELLYISNVVISVYSTTMLDALCFKKPVVQVKFKNEIHPIPFEKYNAVLTTTVDNLKNTVDLALNDSKTKDKLSIQRKKFLWEQYGLPEREPGKQISTLLNST